MPVVDSNVLIDALRDDPRATAVVDALLATSDAVHASEVTRFEVLVGMRQGEEEATETLLAQLEWEPVTEPISRLAAALARDHKERFGGIEDGDYLIAATVVELETPLVTANARHFPMFPGLRPAY